jgi:aspartate oxidase
VAAGSSVAVVERMRAVDVLVDPTGAACGVRVRQADGTVGEWLASAVVLASGGIGQVWPLSTNPAGATGDGIAMAHRAGALLRDMEYVQFHPTVLWIDPADRVPGDRGVLVSEAVRGEGAVLVDHRGRRVMEGMHPRGDLAPRDVVSATMQAHLARTGHDHLLLDARHLGEAGWRERFPSILAMLRERGIDPVSEPIPVRPGAHYLCGGVAADLDGRTSVPGLYAVGEVAATGVQGANRLASNSVTEALVAGDRVGALLASISGQHRPPARTYVDTAEPVRPVDPAGRDALRMIMDRGVEVSRTGTALAGALEALDGLEATTGRLDDEVLDMTSMHTVARLVATAALARTESRGCHRRADHPDAVEAWRHHLCLALGPDGAPVLSARPLAEDPDAFLAPRPFEELQEALA